MRGRKRRAHVLRGLLLIGLTTLGLALPAHAERDVVRPETLRHNAPVVPGPVVPGFPIDFVGVVWDEQGAEHGEHAEEALEAHGAVRFRHAGRWGAWVPLVPDGADAPGQWTSGLVGGGDAEAFEVRGLPEHARGPRAVALNTTDGPLQIVGREPVAPQALTSCQTRAEWLADESLMTWAPEFHPAQVMTVHHTATSNGDTDPAATVRAIYEYHAVDNGWGDIGYHYLVDQYGVVYEGRYSGSESAPCATGGKGADFAHESTAGDAAVVTAAHTGGSNSGNVGVALLGDFTYHRAKENTPTSAATASLEDVLVELSFRHAIPADKTLTYTNPVTHEQKVVDAVSGHRDWKATECPGDNLYAMLPDLRSRVAAEVAAMAPAPAVSNIHPTSGETVTGKITVSADVTSDVPLASVDVHVDGSWVTAMTAEGTTWTASVDTADFLEGERQLAVVAIDTDGGKGSSSVTVTVDNEPDPAVTVSVVDLDAHTHTRGGRWDAHAVVQVADSNGNPLPDAWVDGTFTGDGVSPTTATCQIDATRCELHLDGLDKRVVSSVVLTVTDVRDTAGAYDAGSNTDPDSDSDPPGTAITISF